MTFRIVDQRMTAGVGDTVIAEETVTPGKSGKFDAKLIKRRGDHFDIEAFLKVQFFFHDADEEEIEDAEQRKWTAVGRQTFITDWHSKIKCDWDRLNVGRINTSFGIQSYKIDGVAPTAEDRMVNVTFNFILQEAGWMQDHFEIDIHKVAKGNIRSGYGSVGRRKEFGHFLGTDTDGDLSSESLTPYSEKTAHDLRYYDEVPAEAGYATAVHEFGHMIGLGEEYQDSPHTKDIKSVMNHGPVVRPRHYDFFLHWASAKLRENPQK